MQGGGLPKSISSRLVSVLLRTLTIEPLIVSSMRDSSTLISSLILCEMFKGLVLDSGKYVCLKFTRFPLDDLSSCEFASVTIGLIFIFPQSQYITSFKCILMLKT